MGPATRQNRSANRNMGLRKKDVADWRKRRKQLIRSTDVKVVRPAGDVGGVAGLLRRSSKSFWARDVKGGVGGDDELCISSVSSRPPSIFATAKSDRIWICWARVGGVGGIDELCISSGSSRSPSIFSAAKSDSIRIRWAPVSGGGGDEGVGGVEGVDERCISSGAPRSLSVSARATKRDSVNE